MKKIKVIFGYSDTKQLEEAIKKDKEKLELVKLDEKELNSEKVKAQGVFVGLNGYSTFKEPPIETVNYDVAVMSFFNRIGRKKAKKIIETARPNLSKTEKSKIKNNINTKKTY